MVNYPYLKALKFNISILLPAEMMLSINPILFGKSPGEKQGRFQCVTLNCLRCATRQFRWVKIYYKERFYVCYTELSEVCHLPVQIGRKLLEGKILCLLH